LRWVYGVNLPKEKVSGMRLALQADAAAVAGKAAGKISTGLRGLLGSGVKRGTHRTNPVILTTHQDAAPEVFRDAAV
jgi:hypothetical protein